VGFWNFIFGIEYRHMKDFLNKNAIILDVRSQKEWDRGHIEGSMHIPLNQLNERLDEVKELGRPVITCCQSGVRSANAAKFLNLSKINTVNGGSWISLKKAITQS